MKQQSFNHFSKKIDNVATKIDHKLLMNKETFQERLSELQPAENVTSDIDDNMFAGDLVELVNISSSIYGVRCNEIISAEQMHGLLGGRYVGNAVNAFKQSDITQQVYTDTVYGRNVSGMYESCVNLTQALIDAPNAVNTARMYYGCTSLNDVLIGADTTPVDMHEMFMNCSSLPEEPTFVLNLTNASARGVVRMFKGTNVRRITVIHDGVEVPDLITPHLMSDNLEEIVVIGSDGTERTVRTRENSATIVSEMTLGIGSVTLQLKNNSGTLSNQITDDTSNFIDNSNYILYNGVIASGSRSYRVNNGVSYGYIDLDIDGLFDSFNGGDVTLKVSYKISSESNYDKGAVLVGKVANFPTRSTVENNANNYKAGSSIPTNITALISNVSGTSVSTYTEKSTTLKRGETYRVGFLYKKDGTGNTGDDRFYISTISLTGNKQVEVASNVTYDMTI